MQNTILILVAVICIYAIFKALTSTVDIIFKVIISLLILSFLGYTFFGWEDINPPAETTNQTLLIAEANATETPANATEQLDNEPLENSTATPSPS